MKRIRTRRKARRSSLEARLVAYSAMAGAVLAVSPAQAVECQGGVVLGTVCYTDIPDVTLSDDGTVPVDLDGDGNAELRIRFADGGTTHFGWVRLSASWSVTVKDFAFGLVPGAPIPTWLEALPGPAGPGPSDGGGR
jgi:hypothetical protein